MLWVAPSNRVSARARFRPPSVRARDNILRMRVLGAKKKKKKKKKKNKKKTKNKTKKKEKGTGSVNVFEC